MADVDTRPVLVGVGRTLRRYKKGEKADTVPPLHSFVADALRAAAADAAASSPLTPEAVLEQVEAIACPGRVFEMVVNVPGYMDKKAGMYDKKCTLYPNFPGSVARAAGCAKVRRGELYDTGPSGSMPQWFVNTLAERVARGELRCAAIAGGELLDSMRGTLGKWKAFAKWADDGGGDKPTVVPNGYLNTGDVSEQEKAHGAALPTMLYPLYEQALRGHLRRSVTEHQLSIGKLTSGMSRVAARQGADVVWAPEEFTAEQVAAEGKGNRYISYPYTKRMVANPTVDMAAAVLMMSAGHARSLGIPEERLVYVAGCGDARETVSTTARPELHRVPSLDAALSAALRQAGLMAGGGGAEGLRAAAEKVAAWDLYCCFPSSAGFAARALGLDPEDGERMTLTGGLMFHGGPGANTATHAIAAMVDRLRAGKAGETGVVYANGGILTKQSVGVYTTRPGPPRGAWAREDPRDTQAAVDAAAPPRAVAARPVGEGVVETYTVVFPQVGGGMIGSGSGPERTVVVGSVTAGADKGKRFIATTPRRSPLSEQALRDDLIGRTVTLAAGEDGLTEWGLPGGAKL